MPPELRTRVGDDAHARNLAQMISIIQQYGFGSDGSTVRDENALETIFFSTARLDPGRAIVLSDNDRASYVQSLYSEAMASGTIAAFRAKFAHPPQAGTERVFAPRAPGRVAAARTPDPWAPVDKTAMSQVRTLVAAQLGVDPDTVTANVSISYTTGEDGRVNGVTVRLTSAFAPNGLPLSAGARSDLETRIANAVLTAASGTNFGYSPRPIVRPVHIVSQTT